MSNFKINSRPRLFNPSVVRGQFKVAKPSKISLSQLGDTNFQSTSSFRYDTARSPLKSTQEISLDWSRFENHTFFNSAESKVNIAFQRIINEYPFDGTLKEVEAFEDSLTGYEKYILDIFPKSAGFLNFSGTSESENPASGYGEKLGTYISVQDRAGVLFPDFSKNRTAESILDFGKDSFSIELELYPAPRENENQIICQKRSNSNDSITVALSESSSTSKCDLIFSVTSGSATLFASSSIEKGRFNHICTTFDRSPGQGILKIFVSESLRVTSSMAFEMGSLSFGRANFIIGSGSSVKTPEWSTPHGEKEFIPKVTFSGSMDEVRVFHSTRSDIDQKRDSRRGIYASNDLKLYFKFNEPTGSFNLKSVVLDSSGNSLHSEIKNFEIGLRISGSISNPLSSENLKRNPILFPSYYKISNLNRKLLVSASLYDRENPNLITSLIPMHFLLEGQYNQGLDSEKGDIGSPISGKSIPGSARIGSAQYLTAFLLIWAKFYDEMKIFVDHFSRVLSVDYDDNLSITDKFLPFVADYYGFTLPSLFSNVDPVQFINGDDIQKTYSQSTNSIKYVQSQIWKRILINLNDITTSKGTTYSIRSLLRSAGINPDNIFNIREYGGPTKRSLAGRRQTKSETATSLDFSGSLNPSSFTPDTQGFSSDIPHLVSPFLSASRVEVGYPEQVGTMVSKVRYPPHGISSDPSDGLLTSGSFTYEAIYQFEKNKDHPGEQSLVRFHVTGTSSPSNVNGVLANVTVVSGAQNSMTSSGDDLKLFVRSDSNSSTSPTLALILTGLNIFDGNLWNVSFGRTRSDDRPETDSQTYLTKRSSAVQSSSYFLRCARQSYGSVSQIFMTSSYFMSAPVVASSDDSFQKISTAYNVSGAFIAIGSQSLGGAASGRFLNSVDDSGQYRNALFTKFSGQVSQIRFWSNALSERSWIEHVRSFKSLGVENPLINFNFNDFSTGSFGRLRVNASTDQRILTAGSDRKIRIFDFSQNGYHLSGSGFEKNTDAIGSETFYFSYLSPAFDISQTDNKVRVRSYQDPELISLSEYATSTPTYEVRKSEEPDDDARFRIEMSSVSGLNEDIMRIFGSLDFFDDALGRPNLLFDEFYPDLDQIRKIYFNRLKEKPDLQIFFDMFKWFSSAYGDLLGQLIPKRTKFLGVNFVIESHVIERSKFRYLFDEIYLKALFRDNDRGNLLLSQIVGHLCKF